MAKFKIGDRVVSHSDKYGITKTGWTGVVTAIYERARMVVRGSDSDGTIRRFEVNTNDFDLASDQHKIIITTDGKTTTATLYDGKTVTRKGTAKCNPDDTFDFATGAELAFDRLMGRNNIGEETKKRNLRELMTPGTFGKSKRFGEFVIVGNTMVFSTRGWMPITDYSADNLETKVGDAIEYLVRPTVPSFKVAAIEYDANKNVVWKRK